MTPDQFQKEFRAALPQLDPSLGIELGEFVLYDNGAMAMGGLSESDRIWLTTVGLPSSAPPFLDFSPSNGYQPSVFPPGYFYLGTTNWGDPIALECSSGFVVRLDHEIGFKDFLIGSSLAQFAQCMCEVQRCVTRKNFAGCERALKRIDPFVDPSFWMVGSDDYS